MLTTTFATTPASNGHTTRTSTALTIAERIRDRAAELAGFLEGSTTLPAEVALDVAANLAGAEGMLIRAVQAIERVGPG